MLYQKEMLNIIKLMLSNIKNKAYEHQVDVK